jgi:hypothetical protein
MMGEAAIGLALMAFTWILLSYSMYMATNHIRTLMAARHASWFRGMGGSQITTSQLDQWFFYQSGLSQVNYTQGIGPDQAILSMFGGGSSSVSASSLSSSSDGPYMATVTFGVSDLDSATNMPWIFLKPTVTFMPSSAMTDGLSVNASCQWDEVGQVWDSIGAAMSGMVSTLENLFSGLF